MSKEAEQMRKAARRLFWEAKQAETRKAAELETFTANREKEAFFAGLQFAFHALCLDEAWWSRKISPSEVPEKLRRLAMQRRYKRRADAALLASMTISKHQNTFGEEKPDVAFAKGYLGACQRANYAVTARLAGMHDRYEEFFRPHEPAFANLSKVSGTYDPWLGEVTP
jgi:hypothetical protein